MKVQNSKQALRFDGKIRVISIKIKTSSVSKLFIYKTIILENSNLKQFH